MHTDVVSVSCPLYPISQAHASTDEGTPAPSVFEFCGQLVQSASPLESLYVAAGQAEQEEASVASKPVNPGLHRHASRVADPSAVPVFELAGQVVQS